VNKTKNWTQVPFSKVPKLKQYRSPEEWLEILYNLHVPKLGGSYAFAKDENGNLWFIEWTYEDECRYLRRSEKKNG